MERNMLRYYLMFDPELKDLKKKARLKGIKVYIRPLLISFGVFHATIEQIIEINDEI